MAFLPLFVRLYFSLQIIFSIGCRKLLLPSFAALPLLMAYAGSTTILIPKPIQGYLGMENLDLGSSITNQDFCHGILWILIHSSRLTEFFSIFCFRVDIQALHGSFGCFLH